MNKLNTLIIIGFLINLILVIITASMPRYEILIIPSVVCLCLCVLGCILIALDKVKAGAIIYIIGCVPFVPLSIVGILGAKKIMNQKKTEIFLNKQYGSD